MLQKRTPTALYLTVCPPPLPIFAGRLCRRQEGEPRAERSWEGGSGAFPDPSDSHAIILQKGGDIQRQRARAALPVGRTIPKVHAEKRPQKSELPE
ncbi:hypothetical protein cyc_07355 [Cyclospora cayetanensis]|uniref:Uncharacterized protein n=1 Tax=Cyclospora cayetanensis TaxID=88456 RepID=A0A1D3CT89_9EIME|nr:hypothetical protein cyc_07355 [Cyclospora cayetanensis]